MTIFEMLNRFCQNVLLGCVQWCSQPKIWGQKIWGEPKYLNISEQYYYVWDTASQSTKSQND